MPVSTRISAAVLAGCTLFFSCQDNEKILPDCTAGTEWSYSGLSGPGKWQIVCIDYGACAGEAQSPIDLGGASDDATLTSPDLRYFPTQTHLYNNGHGLQIDVDPGSEWQFEGQAYALLDIHFHTPAEHTVNGKTYPMEAHFVHRNSVGQTLMSAVLFETGTENAFLQPLAANLPRVESQRYDSADPLQIEAFLPANRSYFTYTGSLSQPPCSEGVQWVVYENPVQVSGAQLNAFEKIYRNNNRPVQQTNGRTVRRAAL